MPWVENVYEIAINTAFVAVAWFVFPFVLKIESVELRTFIIIAGAAFLFYLREYLMKFARGRIIDFLLRKRR